MPDSAPDSIGFLGPSGTFSEEAVLGSADPAVKRVPLATIHDAVMAVQQTTVRWSLVPIENSIEGSVTATLDALAGEASDVVIVGEVVTGVSQCLIARTQIELADITTVVSHPQATGQCAQFLRASLPGARVVAASSTADAVRVVAESEAADWAALGPHLAASLYGCVVLRAGVEDRQANETRFVWLARNGAQGPAPSPPVTRHGAGAGEAQRHKTSLLFWGAGAERPGWLVSCLDAFAQRHLNLTRIESRPRRERLGRYMFFLDLVSTPADPAVAQAIAHLRDLCQEVRELGSYPAAG